MPALDPALDITTFAQRQSEACLRMAYFFQNGTKCQPETCFRMAHVSERHATRAIERRFSQT